MPQNSRLDIVNPVSSFISLIVESTTLTEFGVEKLSDVDPSKYEELLQKVEVM